MLCNAMLFSLCAVRQIYAWIMCCRQTTFFHPNWVFRRKCRDFFPQNIYVLHKKSTVYMSLILRPLPHDWEPPGSKSSSTCSFANCALLSVRLCSGSFWIAGLCTTTRDCAKRSKTPRIRHGFSMRCANTCYKFRIKYTKSGTALCCRKLRITRSIIK